MGALYRIAPVIFANVGITAIKLSSSAEIIRSTLCHTELVEVCLIRSSGPGHPSLRQAQDKLAQGDSFVE